MDLIHDRDSIFAKHLDKSIGRLGVRVLKSPPRGPAANAICERVIGTIRRECLDWLIPLSDSHLRRILKSWIAHYNSGRQHMSLGPGAFRPREDRRVPQKARKSRPLAEGQVGGANLKIKKTPLKTDIFALSSTPAAGYDFTDMVERPPRL